LQKGRVGLKVKPTNL